MAAYRPDIPPHVAETILRLPPDAKRGIRSAIRALRAEPNHGEPLRGSLKGLWKYRVRSFRIVYAINRADRTLRIFAAGHRRSIYEDVAGLVPRQ